MLMISPFAPHICEELWEKTGHKNLITKTPWPVFDPDLAKAEMVTIVVQINGKVRDKFEAERDLSEDQIKEKAFSRSKVQSHLQDKEPRKTICIKNKLINIVL